MALFLLLTSLDACGIGDRRGVSDLGLLDEPSRLRSVVSRGTGAEDHLPELDLLGSWDFEGLQSSWQMRVYQGLARGGVTETHAQSGARSYYVEAPSPGADADAQIHFRVKPATQYKLEGYLRTESLQAVTARVSGAFYIGEFDAWRGDNRDDNRALRWHTDLPRFEGDSGEWKFVSYPFRTTDRTRMLRIAASLGNWGASTGAIYIDDVQLFEIAGPAADDLRAQGDTPSDLQAVDDLAVIGTAEVGRELRRSLHAYPDSEYHYEGLEVRPHATLSFGIGIEDRAGYSSGDGVLFEVSVVVDGARYGLYSRHLNPSLLAADRGWIDERISLDAFRGKTVDLAFRTRASTPRSSSPSFAGDWAVWSAPRVFVPGEDKNGERRPNVILITIDTLRADHVGAYGYSRDTTPHLDRFSRDAVVFENAFTPLPRTTPALASMMTGLYPRAHGLMTLLDVLPEESRTLAERLKDLGYATGAIVTHNTARQSGLSQGFDSFRDHFQIAVNDPRAAAEPLVDAALHWLRQNQGATSFLWLHLWDPHFFYRPPEPYSRWFDPDYRGTFDLYERIRRGEVSLGQTYFQNDLSEDQLRRAIALYDGEIRYTDEMLGRVFEGLEALGLYDESLVIVTADHGESLGEQGYFFEHGEYLYDSTLRIPLLVKLPRFEAAGTRVKGKAMLMDVMPTILGQVGLRELLKVDGKDLALYLEGESEPHPVCFAETGRRFFKENPRRFLDGLAGNWKSARENGWKLIQIPHPDGAAYELYDLSSDPGETTNLYRADDARAASMIRTLEAWLAGFDRIRESSEEAPIDDEQQRSLRALGYLD